MILYNTPTSATDMEFDTKSFIRYEAGATKKEKKYNQNHFLINFSHKFSSLNIVDSFSIFTNCIIIRDILYTNL